MSHSEETTHYKLPLFVDDDTPTWLGDFNEAMSELDSSMKDVSDTNKELESHVVAMSNRLVVDEKDIDANKQDIAELNTTVAGKAPIDHASDTTNYGIGNETLYGHVKLTDTVNADLDVNAGVSATPKMVNTLNDHVDEVFNTLNTHIDNTDTAVGQAEENIKEVQDDLNTLEAVITDLTHEQILYQAKQWDFETGGLIFLSGNPKNWGENGSVWELESTIPTWANWIDVYLTAQQSTFFNEGAATYKDVTNFQMPLIVQTFPTKTASKASSGTGIDNKPITDFCISCPPSFATSGAGEQYATFGAVPFRISEGVITQKLGLSSTDKPVTAFTNFCNGVSFNYTLTSPSVDNVVENVSIYKIVARA